MPAARETVAKKGVAKEAVKAGAKAAKPRQSARGAAGCKAVLAPEVRRHYVEVAAYFIAERGGFLPGRELDYWTVAEAEVDRLLADGLLNP